MQMGIYVFSLKSSNVKVGIFFNVMISLCLGNAEIINNDIKG